MKFEKIKEYRQKTTSFSSAIKSTVRTMVTIMPTVFVFEAVYRLMCTILVRPILNWFTQTMVSLSGSKLLFNGDMFTFFLTPYGWIAGIVYLFISALMIYFEFSVIIIVAENCYRGKPIKLNQAVKASLTTFDSLKGIGIIGFCLYSMILLPFVNTGLSSALIPSLDLPKFVTGELLKSGIGIAALAAAALGAAVVLYLLMLVLPAMVLGRKRFGQAARYSNSIQKGNRVKIVIMFALFAALLSVLVGGLLYLGMYWLGVTEDLGSQEYLSHVSSILMSKRGIGGIFILLVVSGLQMIMAQLILTVLVTIYCTLDGDVAVSPEFREVAREQGFIFSNLGKLALIAVIVLLSVGSFSATYFASPIVSKSVVIGHRGSKYGVENTIGAIQAAIDAGADYVEIDVLLSKDSVPMVIHDKNLKRLSGKDINVYDTSASELEQIVLSQGGYEDRLISLEELINYCRGKIGLLIEFKLHGYEEASLVEKTFEVVKNCDFEDDTIYHTLHEECLEEAKRLQPDYRVGYIIFSSLGAVNSQSLSELGIDFIVIEEGLASEDFFYESNKASLPVFVWTVNEQDAMEECFATGATGVITDLPDLGVKAQGDAAAVKRALEELLKQK